MIPIERVSNNNNEIYLSFDDGPCPRTTPQVLKILKELNVKATFFLVGESSFEHKKIVKTILEDGHSLGDHSWDHKYHHFFRRTKHLSDWVRDSQDKMEREFGVKPVGFRSPAGVRTPHLKKALNLLGVPWIHWTHRFYDTQFAFTEARFGKRVNQVQSGDIILLHDRQKIKFEKVFLRNLSLFIKQLQDKGFDFQALTVERINHANQ